jgi:thiamine biosynthesis lipoprotein
VEAGGDVQASGKNDKVEPWRVGIKNPFKPAEIVKVLHIVNGGVATSGTYIRGQHIYNPHQPQKKINDIVSMSVVGVDIYDTDRFATAAFAMGRAGVMFIENLSGFEGFMIDKDGIGTETSGFRKYLLQ